MLEKQNFYVASFMFEVENSEPNVTKKLVELFEIDLLAKPGKKDTCPFCLA